MSEFRNVNPELAVSKRHEHQNNEIESYKDVQKIVLDLVREIRALKEELEIAQTAHQHAGPANTADSWWKNFMKELKGPILIPAIEGARVKREELKQFGEVRHQVLSAIQKKTTELNKVITSRPKAEQQQLIAMATEFWGTHNLLPGSSSE
jgi:transposase-like protein